MPLTAGARLGPYEIVAPLGAGGMGEVYRARDPRLGRDVAIKVLPAELALDADRLRRFESEARAASALNHPNILVVHDFGTEGGQPYLVSELLEGAPLSEILANEGAIATRRAIEWAQQVARGLAAAHRKGIAHRDLKPSNLFVTADGQVKILDFGLAKRDVGPLDDAARAETRSLSDTSPGTLLGTAGYMSPEQVKGLPSDARSDLFGLGCVLYEMLAGVRAFRGGSAAEVLSAILRDDPPIEALPAGVAKVISRLLEKRPEDRFASATDVVFALESIGLEDSRPPSSAAPSSRPSLRRRLGVALAVAAVAVVAGLAVRHFAAGPQRPRSLAVLPFSDQSAKAGDEYVAAGLTEELITELAQIGELRVISRTSSEALRGSSEPLPAIARRLGVQAIVQGSIARQGTRLRVSAQLVEGATDRHLWAGRYERGESDLFGLQLEIARDIAREIAVTLTPREAKRLAAPKSVDPTAYNEYLLGRFQADRSELDGLASGLRHLRKAVELDPDFADAWVEIADLHLKLGRLGVLASEDALAQAEAPLERALAIDPEHPRALVSLTNLRSWQWRWGEAAEAVRRFDALHLRGDQGRFTTSITTYFIAQGQIGEALRRAHVWLEDDPLSAMARLLVAFELYQLRDLRAALEQCEAALELTPDMQELLLLAGSIHAERGDVGGATRAFERWLVAAGYPPEDQEALRERAAAKGLAGIWRFLLELEDRDEAESGHIWPYRRAVLHARLGERDEAFRWLSAAADERTFVLAQVTAEPAFDGLRGDPRFAALLRRMNLDEEVVLRASRPPRPAAGTRTDSDS